MVIEQHFGSYFLKKKKKSFSHYYHQQLRVKTGLLIKVTQLKLLIIIVSYHGICLITFPYLLATTSLQYCKTLFFLALSCYIIGTFLLGLSPLFSVCESYDTLGKLTLRKSPGEDNFDLQVLHLSAPIVTAPLVHIFVSTFKSGKIPSIWKTAQVIPMHKGDFTGDVNNY